MNITEFAEIAGVSKSAVSRYFNDGYLSEEKAEKIRIAIEKTGYAPSLSARSIKTRITKLVGVIIPKLSSESCARMTEGISQVLEEEGYELLLVNTANDFNKEISSLELFRTNRVDGVILMASVFTRLHRAVLKKMKVPTVILGQNYSGYSCVCHNDLGAAYSLTKHMIENGAKKPAIIAVNMKDAAAGKARYDGFMKVVCEQNIKLLPKHYIIGDFNVYSGYEATKKLMSTNERPDAIFCATDAIAVGAEKYCAENNIKVPDDVMICGVGDSIFGKFSAPPITSAHLHYKTAGAEAANMLLSKIKNNDKVPRTLQLEFEIIKRKSTDKTETI